MEERRTKTKRLPLDSQEQPALWLTVCFHVYPQDGLEMSSSWQTPTQWWEACRTQPLPGTPSSGERTLALGLWKALLWCWRGTACWQGLHKEAEVFIVIIRITTIIKISFLSSLGNIQPKQTFGTGRLCIHIHRAGSNFVFFVNIVLCPCILVLCSKLATVVDPCMWQSVKITHGH